MESVTGLLLARLALAVVFFLAGATKLADRAGSQATMVSFGVPPVLAPLIGVVLPLLELAVAIALIPAASSRWGALGALLLLGAFSLGIVVLLAQGRHADCRCFGQLHSSAVGWPTLVRNIALALIAAFLVAGQRESSPSYMEWFGNLGTTEWMVLSVAVVSLSALAAGGWFVMHLMRQHGRILLRLDALETELAERGVISLPAGLPVGALAPSFNAANLQGGSTSLSELLAPRRPLLMAFISPSCAPCTATIPDIAGWEAAHGDRLTVALVSQGTLEENREKLAAVGVRHVLVQRSREIAEAFGAHTTPSAVLISREGTIASPVAEGVIACRDLLRSIIPDTATKPQREKDVATPQVSFDAG